MPILYIDGNTYDHYGGALYSIIRQIVTDNNELVII